MKTNQKLRKIINYYGIKKQLKYFQTEIFELNEAILNYEKNSFDDTIGDICRCVCNCFNKFMGQKEYKDPRKEHVIEEIADVMVMLKQIQLNYNIRTEEIKEVMKFKIDRQLKRIKEENENK
ncbi:MAG: hypothetical protein IJV31_08125 [Clostridia bacterium]|nr:hypothetical protein [Clostridia bacterium]